MVGFGQAIAQDKLTVEIVINQTTCRNAVVSPDGQWTSFLKSTVQGLPARKFLELWTIRHPQTGEPAGLHETKAGLDEKVPELTRFGCQEFLAEI
jgi:hypothetical protein